MCLYKNAFTLIELLIVIVIIGILAALAIPQYEKFKEKAVAAEAVTMLDALRQSVARYYIETGDYPSHYAATKDTATLLSSIGLDIKVNESNPNRKWDYGVSGGAEADHADGAGNPTTDYHIYAWPHDQYLHTRDADEMDLWWHGHLYKGKPVKAIINRYTWPNPPDGSTAKPHTWADH